MFLLKKLKSPTGSMFLHLLATQNPHFNNHTLYPPPAIPIASVQTAANTLVPPSASFLSSSSSVALGRRTVSIWLAVSVASREGVGERLQGRVTSTLRTTMWQVSLLIPGLRGQGGDSETTVPVYPVSSLNSLTAAEEGDSDASIKPAGSSRVKASMGGRYWKKERRGRTGEKGGEKLSEK